MYSSKLLNPMTSINDFYYITSFFHHLQWNIFMKYNSLNPKPLCGFYIFRAVIIEHGLCRIDGISF